MNIPTVLFLLYAFVSVCLGFPQNHEIAKRAVSQRSLADPGNCIQNCSIGTAVPQELANANPIAINCYFHKLRSECYEKCPVSEARTVIIDNTKPFTSLCQVPPEVLAEDSACARNQSSETLTSCDQKCPPSPSQLISPSVIVDPFFTRAVVVNFESDGAFVNQKLIEMCNFGTCQWSCKKGIIEESCGKDSAKRIEIGYNLAFQTIPKLYVDLKVIDQVPEECKKYVLEKI